MKNNSTVAIKTSTKEGKKQVSFIPVQYEVKQQLIKRGIVLHTDKEVVEWLVS